FRRRDRGREARRGHGFPRRAPGGIRQAPDGSHRLKASAPALRDEAREADRPRTTSAPSVPLVEMSNLRVIATEDAPAAIGPYSQAVVHDGLVYTAGQIPIDPRTGELVAGDIALQTERVLENLSAVLRAAGSSLQQVVRTTVYLRDMNEFTAMNEVYAR